MFFTSVVPTAVTSSTTPSADGIPAVRIAVCSVLFLVTFVTIVGNIIVILAFIQQRSLRTKFNAYIFNLAVTDVAVALTAMSFYTFDVLLGYWPFGEVLCGIWIFFDYGMTFASVFTLVAISVDRYWSVAWSIHYRINNTVKKTAIIITVVWLAVLAVWLAPCITDRIQWSEPNFCKWEPSRNREYVVFVAAVGHHTPCIILLFCYFKVFQAMRQRSRIKPRRFLHPDVSTVNALSTATAGRSVGFGETSVAVTQSSAADLVDSTRGGEKQGGKAKTQRETELSIFITLSYIIFCYLICWVPFHFVFDISAINPDYVPEVIYTATFWLTYFNSSLNPILYAFSSKEYRHAFISVIKCRWKR